VAEVIVRTATWLYVANPEVRMRKREEWLRVLEDMKPAERPSHAGTLLWLGARRIRRRGQLDEVAVQRLLRILSPMERQAIEFVLARGSRWTRQQVG
jgi:hypothetical protein